MIGRRDVSEVRRVDAIDHTGVTVRDLEESIHFYRDVLGLHLVIGPTDWNSGEAFSLALGVKGARVRFAALRCGDGLLELLEYAAPPPPVQGPMPMNTLGAMHVAFQVDDIEARVTHLKSKGVRFLSEIQCFEQGPMAGLRWVYFHDPDQITLALVEAPPQGADGRRWEDGASQSRTPQAGER